MGRTTDLRANYDAVRSDLDGWLGDYVRDRLGDWSSGETAKEYFGSGASSLDSLCLLSGWEKQMAYVLADQIRSALDEGHSWNEIAAAIGVSRQAVRKRFGWA